jgi:hypothetical protein
MDVTRRSWLLIASEFESWTAELPRLIRRIDEVLASAYVVDSQALEAELIIERIGLVLRGIQTAVNSDGSKERLRASADLLREEVAAADEILDGLLKQR